MCVCKISERYHNTEKHCLLPHGQNGAELKDRTSIITIPITHKELAAHGRTEESMGGAGRYSQHQQQKAEPPACFWNLATDIKLPPKTQEIFMGRRNPTMVAGGTSCDTIINPKSL